MTLARSGDKPNQINKGLISGFMFGNDAHGKFAKVTLLTAAFLGTAGAATAQNYDGIGRLRFGVFMQGHLIMFRLGIKWIYGHDHYVDDVKRRYQP